MDRLVSVIIPVYMVENYLDQCIKSVVEQSYCDLEIILVDDGSKDNCPEICDNWARKDNRIKVIHQKNGGLSEARNTGIDIANGDYIAFLDSDDFVDEDWIKLLVEGAIKSNADLIICGRFIYENKIVYPKHCLEHEKLYTSKEALKELFYGEEFEEAAWDKLYRKDLFSNIRFPKGEINEDIVTIPYIIEKCNLILHIGNALYYYRQADNSITKSVYNENKKVYIKHIECVKTYFVDKYPDLNNDIMYFVGRYSYALLLDLSINYTAYKKYRKDYNIYLSFLKESWKYLLKNKKLAKKDKIQIILLIINIFPFLIRIKKEIVSKKNNYKKKELPTDGR